VCACVWISFGKKDNIFGTVDGHAQSRFLVFVTIPMTFPMTLNEYDTRIKTRYDEGLSIINKSLRIGNLF